MDSRLRLRRCLLASVLLMGMGCGNSETKGDSKGSTNGSAGGNTANAGAATTSPGGAPSDGSTHGLPRGGAGMGTGDRVVCGVSHTCEREGARNPTHWPFDRCSPFNHPIGDGARYEPIRPRLDNEGWSKYGSWVRDWATFGCMQTGDNAIYVAGAPPHHAGVVRNEDGSKSFDLLLPDDISPPDDIDKHVFVLDPANDLIVETLTARVEDGDVIAQWVLAGPMRDSGIWEGGYEWSECPGCGNEHRGTRAYGGSGIAGVIRRGELDEGIHHAIAVKVPPDAMNQNGPEGNCWTWPASACDGYHEERYGTEGNVYMGSLLAIPPDADLSFISDARIRNIAEALQTYGAYVTDAGSPIQYGDGFPGCVVYMGEWNNPAAVAISEKWEEMGKMTSLLQVVANNGPNNVGGGGHPRACFAPAL